MTNENVAAAMPRLERLRQVVGDSVNLSLDVWQHGRSTREARTEIKWTVWDGTRQYVGATIDDALRAAEAANDLISGGTLELVVLPVCGDAR